MLSWICEKLINRFLQICCHKCRKSYPVQRELLKKEFVCLTCPECTSLSRVITWVDLYNSSEVVNTCNADSFLTCASFMHIQKFKICTSSDFVFRYCENSKNNEKNDIFGYFCNNLTNMNNPM